MSHSVYFEKLYVDTPNNLRNLKLNEWLKINSDFETKYIIQFPNCPQCEGHLSNPASSTSKYLASEQTGKHTIPKQDKKKTRIKQPHIAKNLFFTQDQTHLQILVESRATRSRPTLFFSQWRMNMFLFFGLRLFFRLVVVIDVLVELHVWLIMNALERWIF